MLQGGAALLDSLCALLAALMPPPQQLQPEQPTVDLPQLDGQAAHLAAPALEAAAALLQHDSSAQAAALASCGAARPTVAPTAAGDCHTAALTTLHR